MHFPKLSLLGLCVLATCTMSFAVSSAQAANWLILNSKGEVKTGTELSAILAGRIEFTLVGLSTHLVKLPVEVSCGIGSLTNAKLEASGQLTKGFTAQFTACVTRNAATKVELPECGVKAGGSGLFGIIVTNALKGQLQSNGETEIKPVGTEFAKLEFEAGCVLPSPTTLSGTLFVEDCEGKAAEHLVEHLIKQGVGTSLFVGADNKEHLETSLVGTMLVSLSGEHSGLKWGAIFP
jgi:hypothetical protein